MNVAVRGYPTLDEWNLSNGRIRFGHLGPFYFASLPHCAVGFICLHLFLQDGGDLTNPLLWVEPGPLSNGGAAEHWNVDPFLDPHFDQIGLGEEGKSPRLHIRHVETVFREEHHGPVKGMAWCIDASYQPAFVAFAVDPHISLYEGWDFHLDGILSCLIFHIVENAAPRFRGAFVWSCGCLSGGSSDRRLLVGIGASFLFGGGCLGGFRILLGSFRCLSLLGCFDLFAEFFSGSRLGRLTDFVLGTGFRLIRRKAEKGRLMGGLFLERLGLRLKVDGRHALRMTVILRLDGRRLIAGRENQSDNGNGKDDDDVLVFHGIRCFWFVSFAWGFFPEG